MSANIEIAVIGDSESVMLFKAVGLHTVPVSSAHQAEKAIHQLARANCKVIYITEQIAAMAQEAIARYNTETFPAIIPIPNRSGSDGTGMAGIRKNVEKAIGADILFGKGR